MSASAGRQFRGLWIGLVVVLLLMMGVIALAAVLDQRAPIVYYRVVDDHALTVGAGTGPSLWARVTSVTETKSSVTIGASNVRLPLPSTNDQVVELAISLSEPLGERTVIDASSGLAIPPR
jgi:hypothetical protein